MGAILDGGGLLSFWCSSKLYMFGGYQEGAEFMGDIVIAIYYVAKLLIELIERKEDRHGSKR